MPVFYGSSLTLFINTLLHREAEFNIWVGLKKISHLDNLDNKRQVFVACLQKKKTQTFPIQMTPRARQSNAGD